MLRVRSNTRSVFSEWQFLFSGPVILWALAMGLALLLLPMTMAKSQPTAIDAASLLLSDPNPIMREQGINALAQLGNAEATNQLALFFQRDRYLSESGLTTARALAEIGTPQAYQVLIDALRVGQPQVRRQAALTALREAQPSVEPSLTAALSDPDAQLRQSVAQLLDDRRVTAGSINMRRHRLMK